MKERDPECALIQHIKWFKFFSGDYYLLSLTRGFQFMVTKSAKIGKASFKKIKSALQKIWPMQCKMQVHYFSPFSLKNVLVRGNKLQKHKHYLQFDPIH